MKHDTGEVDESEITVLWLQPSVGDNISVRRERIAEGLANRGVDVDIKDASGIDALSALYTGISNDYDLVVGTVRMGLYLGYPLSRMRRLPFVAEVTEPLSRVNHLPQPVYRFLECYETTILRRADAAFYVETDVLEDARDRGIDGTLAKNAVWYDRFTDPDLDAQAEAKHLLSKTNVNLDGPIAIFVGGFDELYHIPTLLEAARRCPEWEFVFLGENGNCESAVVDAASTHENIHYPGAVPHELVSGFLTFADVGFCLVDAQRPLKVLEYGAAGLITIGIPGKLESEFTEDELLFVEPTPESVAGALEDIRKRPDRVPIDGTELQRTAKKNSWKTISDQYYNIFSKLI